MERDPIEQQLPWLTPWFTTSPHFGANFNGQESQLVGEISSGWRATPKIQLFDSLSARYSREMVARVIDKIVAVHTQQEWEETSRNLPGRTIDDFVRLLWQPLSYQDFDVIIKKRLDGTQINCTRCPHASLGKQVNGSFWLYHLVCSGDAHAAAGFNLRIGFHRTQTLMEGDPCCDHFYFMLE